MPSIRIRRTRRSVNADVRVPGDKSISHRALMGASVATGADGRPPVVLRRSREPLRGRRIELPVASAQVKSAVAFAALRADGPTVIVQPLATRDHTERMLRSMGADVRIDGLTVVVNPSALAPLSGLRVPGDFSSAFYFIAAAAACPSARVRIRAVGVNPSRVAALEI